MTSSSVVEQFKSSRLLGMLGHEIRLLKREFVNDKMKFEVKHNLITTKQCKNGEEDNKNVCCKNCISFPKGVKCQWIEEF